MSSNVLKEYHCAKCRSVVAKLKTDSGNQLRTGMRMICNACWLDLDSKSDNIDVPDFFQSILNSKGKKCYD